MKKVSALHKTVALSVLAFSIHGAWAENAQNDEHTRKPPKADAPAQTPVPAADAAVPHLPAVVVQGRRESLALQAAAPTRGAEQALDSADAARFLTRVPGFAVMRKGGGNSEAILRGMAGSRLGILADGVPVMGGCILRMDSPLSYIYPDAYDEVTLIKGPQSVAKGAGLSAGVVEFKRRKPVFEKPGIRFDGAALFGSFGRNDQMSEVLAGNAQWHGRVSGTRSESQSYKDGKGRRVHSAWQRWSGDVALGWTPDARTRLELSGGASDGQADYADRHSDAIRLHRSHWTLKLEKEAISPLLKRVDAYIYRQHTHHVMDNYSRRAIHPSWNGILMVMNPQNRIRAERVSVDLEPARDVLLKIGLDHQHTQTHDRMAMFYPAMVGRPGLPPDVVYRNTTDYRRIPLKKYHDATQTGLFSEWQWPLDAQNLQRMAGGLRLDRAKMQLPSVKAATRRTLRSGFIRYERDIENGGSFYAGIGHSQRFPDYWEYIWIHNRTGGATYASLKPERLTQLDVGISVQKERWNAKISGFYGRTKDFILIHWRPQTFVENIDARQYGLEAEAQSRLTAAWTASAAVAWVRGFNLTRHITLPQRPPLTATLALRHEQGRFAAGAKVRASMRQKRFDYGNGNLKGFDRGPTPGFATVSLDASWKPHPNLTLGAGIDNLFNRQYTEHLSAGAALGTPRSLVEPISPLYEPGRAVWVRLNYRF